MKTSEKAGVAERNHYTQDPDLLHCLLPHQRNWGKPRVTHGKRQGSLSWGQKGEVFPPRCSLRFYILGSPQYPNQQSECCYLAINQIMLKIPH